jgi:hypothetical protein
MREAVLSPKTMVPLCHTALYQNPGPQLLALIYIEKEI